MGQVVQLDQLLSNLTIAPSKAADCSLCGDTGWERREGGVRQCECRKRRIVASKAAEIPERFRGSTLENYIPVDADQAEAKRLVLQNLGGNLYIWGGYGRGKTHLAAAQYHELVKAGANCYWRGIADLIAEIRDAELRDVHSSILHAARYGSLHLFIDDLDKFKKTDWKDEALYTLFNLIYSRKLGLTVTANYFIDDLDSLLDPSIRRRIDDSCVMVRV